MYPKECRPVKRLFRNETEPVLDDSKLSCLIENYLKSTLKSIGYTFFMDIIFNELNINEYFEIYSELNLTGLYYEINKLKQELDSKCFNCKCKIFKTLIKNYEEEDLLVNRLMSLYDEYYSYRLKPLIIKREKIKITNIQEEIIKCIDQIDNLHKEYFESYINIYEKQLERMKRDKSNHQQEIFDKFTSNRIQRIDTELRQRRIQLLNVHIKLLKRTEKLLQNNEKKQRDLKIKIFNLKIQKINEDEYFVQKELREFQLNNCNKENESDNEEEFHDALEDNSQILLQEAKKKRELESNISLVQAQLNAKIAFFGQKKAKLRNLIRNLKNLNLDNKINEEPKLEETKAAQQKKPYVPKSKQTIKIPLKGNTKKPMTSNSEKETSYSEINVQLDKSNNLNNSINLLDNNHLKSDSISKVLPPPPAPPLPTHLHPQSSLLEPKQILIPPPPPPPLPTNLNPQNSLLEQKKIAIPPPPPLIPNLPNFTVKPSNDEKSIKPEFKTGDLMTEILQKTLRPVNTTNHSDRSIGSHVDELAKIFKTGFKLKPIKSKTAKEESKEKLIPEFEEMLIKRRQYIKDSSDSEDSDFND